MSCAHAAPPVSACCDGASVSSEAPCKASSNSTAQGTMEPHLRQCTQHRVTWYSKLHISTPFAAGSARCWWLQLTACYS